jgi:hypothetical protein
MRPIATTTSSIVAETTTTASEAFIKPTTTIEVVKPLENAIQEANSPEELKNVINNVDLSTIKSEELVSIIDNTAIEQLSESEIQEVFAEINFDTFSDTELEQISLKLSSAPNNVKAAFEKEIDIYGSGSFDTYVPSGSVVDVGTRRVLIAIATAISTVTITTSSVGSASGENRRK